MAHNLDFSNNRANMAFLGSRNDIWHRLGQEMTEGMSIADWTKAAGLDWHAVKVPAFADLSGAGIERPMASKARNDGMQAVDARAFVVRSDTGAILGDNCVSDVYVPHQPAEVMAWFERYISVDDRFKLDVAGSLRGGSIIWATAVFKEPLDVAGDKHSARILMTTTFDGSGATINRATMTRVVCNNTLDAALSSREKCTISTRHNTKFNAERVGAELAALASGFKHYKAMGDAMAQTHLSEQQVKDFFRDCLDIPRDAKQDDISTRKFNQYRAVSTAMGATRRERNVGQGVSYDAWQALNAITRYVDHDRVSINGDNGEKQFLSAQFGSGSAVKAKAVGLLMPLIADKIAA